jgi:5-methylcytosine-specific restriction endonuclease McrA
MTDEEKKENARKKAKDWYWKNHDRARANNIAWLAANKEHRVAYRKERSNKAKETNAALYISDKDRIKARNSAWNKEHPETTNAISKKWKKANPDKVKSASAAWRGKNPEKAKAALAAWRKSNPEIMKIHNHNRRARIKNNGGKLSPNIESKLLAFQKNRCAVCRTSLKKTGHHLDHIVPLAGGGKNIDGNMQITCPKCNLEKHSENPILFMRKKGFLL